MIDAVSRMDPSRIDEDEDFGLPNHIAIRPDIVLPLKIDIKPGSDPNCFNISGHGVIPVAIFGSNDLDVGDIDFDTLLFEGLAVRVRGNQRPLCSFEFVDEDSLIDLVCHFEDNPEAWKEGNETATLTGSPFNGTVVAGSDAICIVS